MVAGCVVGECGGRVPSWAVRELGSELSCAIVLSHQLSQMGLGFPTCRISAVTLEPIFCFTNILESIIFFLKNISVPGKILVTKINKRQYLIN